MLPEKDFCPLRRRIGEVSSHVRRLNTQRSLKNMIIFRHAAGFSFHRSGKQNLVSLLLWALCFAISPQSLLASQDQDVPPQRQDAQQGPGQLQQLVAPIALYPDSLVSQILAASTYPEQVVEADRWVQAHPALQGDALGQAVDQQPWDPSIKALTAFPSVLGNMDKKALVQIAKTGPLAAK
jgi:hypothetical protein